MNMDHNKQAIDFLESCKVGFKAEKAVPQQRPLWAKEGEKHGTCYNITLTKYREDNRVGKEIFYSNPISSVQFLFWNSIKAKEDAEHGKSDKPKAYDVLAGIYTSVNSFEDFCSSFGYDEDSRTAERTYEAVVKLNKKLESIFTSDELARLSEIN